MQDEQLNPLIPVFSQGGYFLVDRETGKCDTTNLKFTAQNKLPIVANLAELRAEYGELATWGYDIMDVGYWNAGGQYIPPCTKWRAKRTKLQDTYSQGIIEFRGQQCMA